MAVNDVWEFLLVSTYLGQQCLNRFIYLETTSGGGTPTNHAQAVWEHFKTELRPLVSNNVQFTEMRAKNLTDGVSIGTYAIPTGEQLGTVTGESLPVFVTYSFRMNRATASTRHGYKRFAGVPETANQNGVLATAFNSNVTAVAADLLSNVSGVVTGDTSLVLAPRIRSTILGGVARPTPVLNAISSVTFEGFGTQNTRKP